MTKPGFCFFVFILCCSTFLLIGECVLLLVRLRFFSIPSQEIVLGNVSEKNDLFYVEWDVKPQLSQSTCCRVGVLMGSMTVHDIPLPSQPPSQLFDLSQVPLPPDEPPLPPCLPSAPAAADLVRLVTTASLLRNIATQCSLLLPMFCGLCQSNPNWPVYADVFDHPPLWLASRRPIMQWREDWSSASVISHSIVTDPTIRQPFYDVRDEPFPDS